MAKPSANRYETTGMRTCEDEILLAHPELQADQEDPENRLDSWASALGVMP